MAFETNYGFNDLLYEDRSQVKSKDELLIDLVEQRPWLYNKAARGYSDRVKNDVAWVEIGNALQLSGEECWKRWLQIKAYYDNEVRYQLNENVSGAGRSNRAQYHLYGRLKSLFDKTTVNTEHFSNVTPKSVESPKNCYFGNNKQKKTKPVNAIESVLHTINGNMVEVTNILQNKISSNEQQENLQPKDPNVRLGQLIEEELDSMPPKKAKLKCRELLNYLNNNYNSDDDDDYEI